MDMEFACKYILEESRGKLDRQWRPSRRNSRRGDNFGQKKSLRSQAACIKGKIEVPNDNARGAH
eukprot:scaffold175257_cov14-Tisochrysis_lutea.AAC.1